MKYTAVIFLISLFLLTGCRQPAPPAPPTGNTNQSPPPAPQTSALAPKDVLKALNAASKAGNIVEIKRYLSQGTLMMLDEAAEEAGKTPDEVLTGEGGGPFRVLPEMREEKVDGDTATVEVQNMLDKKEYEKIPFVKENGEWKVALDIYMDDLERRITEEMKNPAKKPAPNVKK